MNLIKGVLHNLSASENIGKAPAYCHGIIVAVVSCLMQDRRLTFAESILEIKRLLPKDYDLDRIPTVYHDIFKRGY